MFGKVPPQAKDLEEAVLGAIMLEKNAFDVIVEILNPECFYVEAIKEFSGPCRACNKKIHRLICLPLLKN